MATADINVGFAATATLPKSQLQKYEFKKMLCSVGNNYYQNTRKKFVSEINKFQHEKFAGFKFGKDRLDAFFYDVLNTQKTYEDLWTIVKFLLTLYHGQAAVERGFSVKAL